MKITLIKGDITTLIAEAIVNAANTSLLGGGGVDGAIHRRGGPAILEECKKIRGKQGGCKTGEAVITTAGKLPSSYVIHTVGPVWNGPNIKTDQLLENCYKNSILLAKENGIKCIAFPNISTGIYKFPKKRAAEIAIETVEKYNELSEVIFCCFDENNYNIYKELLKWKENIKNE